MQIEYVFMKRFLLKLWTTIRNFFCPKKSDMKIFNKVVWGKVAPENKRDIWFDGSNLRIYTEGSWEIILRGSGGGNIDPELLEGYMPLSREFSDDFNNDFAR